MAEASSKAKLKLIDDLLDLTRQVEEVELEHLDLSIRLARAKQELLLQEDQLLLKGMDGPINGKNERIREAQLRELLEPGMSQVASLQIDLMTTDTAQRILKVKQSALEHAALLMSKVD